VTVPATSDGQNGAVAVVGSLKGSENMGILIIDAQILL
jgi:hypothetical protein